MSTPQDPRNPQRQFVPQVNDERNNAGRFDLVERRSQEDAERIEANRRAQARSLFVRTHAPGTPIPAELQEPAKGGR